MKTPRRVILSGTPIQVFNYTYSISIFFIKNDLGELYAMVDYINPGILGKK